MYRIGELARRCEISTETIRFYEREGLLTAPPRAANGYRLYSDSQLGQLKFILRGKNAGLSIADMRELLELRQSREVVSCREVRQVIDNKLALVRQQLQELQKFEASLSQLSHQCCGGEESAAHCSILEAFDDLME